jgi:hypothetical protein
MMTEKDSNQFLVFLRRHGHSWLLIAAAFSVVTGSQLMKSVRRTVIVIVATSRITIRSRSHDGRAGVLTDITATNPQHLRGAHGHQGEDSEQESKGGGHGQRSVPLPGEYASSGLEPSESGAARV